MSKIQVHSSWKYYHVSNDLQTAYDYMIWLRFPTSAPGPLQKSSFSDDMSGLELQAGVQISPLPESWWFEAKTSVSPR
jgi:hypothetical protein